MERKIVENHELEKPKTPIPRCSYIFAPAGKALTMHAPSWGPQKPSSAFRKCWVFGPPEYESRGWSPPYRWKLFLLGSRDLAASNVWARTRTLFLVLGCGGRHGSSAWSCGWKGDLERGSMGPLSAGKPNSFWLAVGSGKGFGG